MLDKGNLPPDTLAKDKTGYFYEGSEIVTIRKQGAPRNYRSPTYFDQERKVDAATLYCVYGDFAEVSKLTDVPIKYLQQWKSEPWWAEVQKQIFDEQNSHLSARISAVLDKAIVQIADRLDNGDQTYNPKTGEITRKPIEAKTLASLFDSLSHQRRITRGEPTAISTRIGVDDRLVKLEEAFRRFAQVRTVEGEVIGNTHQERE